MKIYYGKAVYDQKEISASVRVLKNSMTLIDGPAVKELEKKSLKYLEKIRINGEFRFVCKPIGFGKL